MREPTHFAGTKPAALASRPRFGDDAYAIEELVAELGAAFLCADLGISDEPRADHAQYLEQWLIVLKADKKAIFTAASKASEAVAFLTALPGRKTPASLAQRNSDWGAFHQRSKRLRLPVRRRHHSAP